MTNKFRIALLITITSLLQWSCAQNPYIDDINEPAIEVISGQGNAGKALIVYNPGFSDFQQTLTFSFAQGLADSDWKVDWVTAGALDVAT